MTKRRIIGTLLLFAAFGAFGAVYKFYFEEKLQSYRQDQELLVRLETTREDIEQFFSYVQPDVLTNSWRAQIQSWDQALNERSRYFHFGDWQDFPEYPGDGPILRFWYQDRVDEMMESYYRMIYEKMGRYDLVPDVSTVLNLMTIDTWDMMDGDEQYAHRELARLSFAMSFMEMLLDYDVSAVTSFSMWPRAAAGPGQLLTRQTVGVQVSMSAQNFIRLIESMRTSDRYFTIDAMKIAYPYIGYEREPELFIELLITQARFRMPEVTDTGITLAADNGTASTGMMSPMQGMGMMGPMGNMSSLFDMQGFGGQRQPPPEPGMFDRAWRWFKRVVLVTN